MSHKNEQPEIHLKRPLKSYQPRLTRFLHLMLKVKSLEPYGLHLWRIMDGPVFQDMETALKIVILNEKTKVKKRSG